MPLTKPEAGEDQKSYMERCMSDPKNKEEFPNHRQRLAYCLGSYTRYNRKKT